MKPIHFLLGCLFLLSPGLIISQQDQSYFSYYQSINRAELAYTQGQFADANIHYQQAFQQVDKPFSQDLFLAAVNAQKLNSPKECQAYLLQSFAHGLQIKQFKNHLELYPFIQENKLKSSILKGYKKERKNYLATLNLDLKKTIEEMIKKDQKVRSGKYNKMPWKKQQQFMRTIDSLNFLQLLQICKTQGVPGYQSIGENRNGKYNVTDFAFLLRHMHEEELDQLHPYIIDAITQGELSPWDYASALDYTSMFKTTIEDRDENGHPILIIQQKYGTITFTNDSGERQLYHIKNKSTANQLRKEIGMETMEEEAQKRKVLPAQEGEYKKVFK